MGVFSHNFKKIFTPISAVCFEQVNVRWVAQPVHYHLYIYNNN